MVRDGIKDFTGDRDIDNAVTGNLGVNRGLLLCCQSLFCCLSFSHQHAAVGMRQERTARLINNPAIETLVKVIAAQLAVAAGGEHFEDTLAQTKNGDVKGTAA